MVGDIKKCFDSIDHNLLLKFLSEKIGCQKTLALIKSAIKAGYIDLGKWVSSGEEGTPQGSILSPLLCNVFLHKLDEFIMRLKMEIDQGEHRRTNPTYRKIQYQSKKWGHDLKQSRGLRTLLRQTSTKDYMDPKYLRLHYVRYADDFVIAIAGPRRLAVEILNKVRDFLANDLKLDLSEEKTKLMHFTKKPIFFLGAFILNRMLEKNKPVNTDVHAHKKRISIHISLGAPTMTLKRRLMEKGFLKYDKDRFSIRGNRP